MLSHGRYKCQFFTTEEFQKCVPSCYISDMKDDLLIRLDIARHIYGSPITLTSAYRSSEWDKAKGRSGTGAHTKGLAVDIRCSNTRNRYLLLKALLFAGFFRIGIAKNFIHVDIDTSKPAGIWFYEE